MPRARSTPPRGSTLLLVTILLMVLMIIGVAAIRISSQERINAVAKGKRDFLAACANAAKLALWTQIARSSPEYLQSDTALPSTIRLDDGTVLSAPSAPGWTGKDGLPVAQLVKVSEFQSAKAAAMGDMSNNMVDPRSLNNSRGYGVLARCTDPKGRELLAEFTIKFAL